MTRQLIICSALIASVTGPALAGTNVASNPAAAIRISNPTLNNRLTNPAAARVSAAVHVEIPVDPCRSSAAAACSRISNPALLFKATKDLSKVTNTVEWLRRPIPVDFVPRFSNPAERFVIRDSAAVPLQATPIQVLRLTNPADAAGAVHGLVCKSAAIQSRLGLGACFLAPEPVGRGIVHPLFTDDEKLHRTCLAAACIPFRLHEPAIWQHQVSTQDRVGLNLHTSIQRRMPAPGKVLNIQLHVGDTTSVTGGIDNQ
jgi:hypothetical protein